MLYENFRDANIWSHQDSIATHLTCSRLQRVDIQVNILCLFCYDNEEELVENEVLEAVLDVLPLLGTKGILFVTSLFGGLMQLR
jgi:hypothetical protein